MALTERQYKRQWYWTCGCFRRALLDQYDSELSPKEKRYSLPDLKYTLLKRGLESNTPEINARYLKNLTSMSTERLNIVLNAAERCRRKQETIDAIMTELFERSVNPETKEKHE